MKTPVKVVGLGRRADVKDKSGKEYSFVPLAIAFKDEKFVGYRANVFNVKPEKIPASLTVGENIEVEFGTYRGKLYLKSIG